MEKQLLHERLLAVTGATLFLAVLFIPRAFCQGSAELEAGIHNQQGMEYFKKGFYDHATKNQVEAAQKYYVYAVNEFRAAISKDSSYAEAHRNLARLYYVQKDFAGAAEEYKRGLELTAGDLDGNINLDLALIELERFDEATLTRNAANKQNFDSKPLTALPVP